MFLMFLKPKERKQYRGTSDYIDACSIHTPFHLAQVFLTIMWFACLLFLFIAFDETIKLFLVVTALCVLAELISKSLHPDYYYFGVESEEKDEEKAAKRAARIERVKSKIRSRVKSKEHRVEFAVEEKSKNRRYEFALVRKVTREKSKNREL